MSNPYSQGVQPGAVRPGVVTVAGYLLFVVAAAMLLGAVTSLVSVGPTRDVYADAYAGTEAEGVEGFLIGGLILGVIINLLIAVGFVILAIFNNRGKNPSRITTWAIGGIAICCTGLGLAGNAVGSAMTGFGNVPSQSGMPDPETLSGQLEDAIPAWVTPVSLVASVLALLCLIAVVVLLSLPPANDFFRKPVAAWQPPGTGYPGYPSAYPPPSQAPYPPQPAAPESGPVAPESGTPSQPGDTPSDYPPPGRPSSRPPGYDTPPAGADRADPPSAPGTDSPPRS